jgi:hypothetical protein
MLLLAWEMVLGWLGLAPCANNFDKQDRTPYKFLEIYMVITSAPSGEDSSEGGV